MQVYFQQHWVCWLWCTLLCTRQGAPSGYATIVVLLCFMFAMMFLLIGIIGEYIAILFTELKDRPVYIVEKNEKHIILRVGNGK